MSTHPLVAIGGGGLISGVATAAKALKPSVRIIGIEAEGSPTLKRSVVGGQAVGLDAMSTSVATMAFARTDERVYEVVQRISYLPGRRPMLPPD